MCSWSIRVAIGERILLEFLEFDLENDTKCQSDHLTVYVDEDSRIGDGGSIYTNYSFTFCNWLHVSPYDLAYQGGSVAVNHPLQFLLVLPIVSQYSLYQM